MQTHRVCGGSSSRSAAAVAAGLAVCAVGTNTGASVRLAAGFCGITGLKVAERRLPADGILPLSHTLDTPGPLARSVADADAALIFEVMDGREGVAIDRAAPVGRTSGARWPRASADSGFARGLQLASAGRL